MRKLSELDKAGLRRRLNLLKDKGSDRVSGKRSMAFKHLRRVGPGRGYPGRLPKKEVYFLGCRIIEYKLRHEDFIHIRKVVKDLFDQAGAAF